MTPADFRRLALELPGAEERAHGRHPDFRIGNKIFATLGYPNDAFAMVKVDRDEQAAMIAAHPNAFAPVKGAWGERGSTLIELARARAGDVRKALASAAARLLK